MGIVVRWGASTHRGRPHHPSLAPIVLVATVLAAGILASAPETHAQTVRDGFDDIQDELESAIWKGLVAASSAHPGIRSGAATAQLASPRGLLLFGGQDEDGAFLGDLWQFLEAQQAWVQLVSGAPDGVAASCANGEANGNGTAASAAESAGSPCPRSYASLSMVGTTALLYGGTCARSARYDPPDGAYEGDPCRDDLWEYDTMSGRWRRLDATAGGASRPLPRTSHAAVAQGFSLYVYGGIVASPIPGTPQAEIPSEDSNGLWRYDWASHAWEALLPQGIKLSSGNVVSVPIEFRLPYRYGHAAVVEHTGAFRRLLIHGGFANYTDAAGSTASDVRPLDGHSGPFFLSNDVLEWDLDGGTWRVWEFQYAPFRAYHSLHLYYPALGSASNRHLLFGFGWGHDNAAVRDTYRVVAGQDLSNVRTMDAALFEADSVWERNNVSPTFPELPIDTQDTVGLAPSGSGDEAGEGGGRGPGVRHAAAAAFVDEDTILTVGGLVCANATMGPMWGPSCEGGGRSDAWLLYLKGRLFDEGVIAFPLDDENAKRLDEIAIMSGEMEIARVTARVPREGGEEDVTDVTDLDLSAAIGVPSLTDIVVVAFRDGVVAATARVVSEPGSTNVVTLSHATMGTLDVSCLREDGASALPHAQVAVEVWAPREGAWRGVAQGQTDVSGHFRTALLPSVSIPDGILDQYLAPFDTQYKVTVKHAAWNGA